MGNIGRERRYIEVLPVTPPSQPSPAAHPDPDPAAPSPNEAPRQPAPSR
ncbi:MAG: hypothetical protein QOF92_3408 [Pseudonocardiales bacterium]|jgi:hypothetical protein|nr:hypothetical protein [Pseudonocardiales bacterium]